MTNSNPFTIELANGKERSFAGAAEMTEWLDRQRGLDRPTGRRRMKRNVDRRTEKEKEKARKILQPVKTPLARYANRNSGEA